MTDPNHFPGRIKMQELQGGLSEERKNPSGDIFASNVLTVRISEVAFSLIEHGLLDVYPVKRSPFWINNLYKSGRPRRGRLIRFWCHRGNIEMVAVTCEYEGFFIAQSNHFVSVEGYKKEVSAGDYVIKMGKVLTLKKKI